MKKSTMLAANYPAFDYNSPEAPFNHRLEIVFYNVECFAMEDFPDSLKCVSSTKSSNVCLPMRNYRTVEIRILCYVGPFINNQCLT